MANLAPTPTAKTTVSPVWRRTFGFSDRRSLLSLAHLFAGPDLPTLIVVVELVEPSGGLEARDRDELMAELEDSLAEAAGSTSGCFRLGKTELLVIAPDVELDDADAVVDEIVSAARSTTTSLSADVVIGEVVVPDEAKDSQTALRIARHRLKAGGSSAASSIRA